MALFITFMFFSSFVTSTYFFLEVKGQHQCSTAGIGGLTGCECSFIGACDAQGTQSPGLNMNQHLPTGLEQFGKPSPKSRERNLAYLCEGYGIAILYDCNSRIPLYATTVINGSQFSEAENGRPNKTFRQSSKLHKEFQQSDTDYDKSSARDVCFEARTRGNKKIIDLGWYHAKFSTQTRPGKRPRIEECVAAPDLTVEMHKGHLIASNYGRRNQPKKIATFTYTNAVPQFGTFNSGPWKTFEVRLVKWGQDNCVKNGAARNVQMFIVVGAIPSTYFGPLETRYFGKKGFSDFQDEGYRVNVPKEMWTAACCTFEQKDDKGTWRPATASTAFWRKNEPGNSDCSRIDIGSLEQELIRKKTIQQSRDRTVIKLFPDSSKCNNIRNYVPLP